MGTMAGGTLTMTSGNPGQPMGMITTPRLPSGVDAQKLQRIQALQQELQREYREVGQAQTAQSVTSMGQQQGIVTGQETMIMSQPRMINVQTSMQQQPQGGLRQILQHHQQPQQQQQQQQQQQSDPMLRELLG